MFSSSHERPDMDGDPLRSEIGEFPVGTDRSTPEPGTDQAIRKSRIEGDQRAVVASLGEKLGDLASKMEELSPEQFDTLAQALNMIGAGKEIFVWIPKSKQAEAIRSISEIIDNGGKDRAVDRRAAESLRTLSNSEEDE